MIEDYFDTLLALLLFFGGFGLVGLAAITGALVGIARAIRRLGCG